MLATPYHFSTIAALITVSSRPLFSVVEGVSILANFPINEIFIACHSFGYEQNDQNEKTHEADSHTNCQDFGLKNHIADCLLPIIKVIHSRRNHDNPCKVNTPDFAAVVFELLVLTLDRQRGKEISDELQAVSTRNDKIGVFHH